MVFWRLPHWWPWWADSSILLKKNIDSGLSDRLQEAGRYAGKLIDNYITARGDEIGLVAGSSTLRAAPDDAR